MKTFRKKLEETIALCNDEVENRKKGIIGESTEIQLENVIIPELNEIIKLIDAGNPPPKEERYLISFAHAFTDWGWNMQSPTKLFILLKQLNDEYKNF